MNLEKTIRKLYIEATIYTDFDGNMNFQNGSIPAYQALSMINHLMDMSSQDKTITRTEMENFIKGNTEVLEILEEGIELEDYLNRYEKQHYFLIDVNLI